MSKNRIDIIEQRLQGNESSQIDDRLETLNSAAEWLKVMIQLLEKSHTGINKSFLTKPVDLLWIRYFTIRLRILQLDPETSDLNQGQRAQMIQQEMEGFALTAKKISTISRWDAEKTKSLKIFRTHCEK